ncbi:MAG: hypothetical protein U0638_06015 [Phycisphaerales bacterium]
MIRTPPSELAQRLPDHVVLPNVPPDWLVSLMRPWDSWAERHVRPETDDENVPRYDSWKRAYALMPKSQSEWDARATVDPPHVDYDGALFDLGLRGLSRRLFELFAAEGEGIASDLHPLRGAERLLGLELAELLALEMPATWPDEARRELGLQITECRGLLHCFGEWAS